MEGMKIGELYHSMKNFGEQLSCVWQFGDESRKQKKDLQRMGNAVVMSENIMM